MDEDDFDLIDGEDLIGAVDLIGADDDDDDTALLKMLISGGSELDLIGAKSRSVNPLALAKAQVAKVNRALAVDRQRQIARARNLQRANVDRVMLPNNNARRLILGGTATVANAAATTINIKAQQAYRPDRIVVSATVVTTGAVVDLASIIVNDVRVNAVSMFAGTEGIDAQLFARDFFSNGANLALDTINAGCDLSLSISALTATAQDNVRLRISVLGRALR